MIISNLFHFYWGVELFIPNAKIKLNHVLIYELKSAHMKIQKVKKEKPIKRKMVVCKAFRQIQICDRILYHNMRTYRGSRTDTNLLNIKFKTIICRILD